MLLEAQQIKLNFYSKYNRVKDKQDIDSLLALIDNTEEYISHLEQLTLTLSLSKEDERSEGKSEEGRRDMQKRSKVSKQAAKLRVDDASEEEKMLKFKEMEEKLAKLQKLEKKFHEHIARSDREYQRKKELKQQQRREREKYRSQHINVVQHRSETSQPNQNSSTDQQMYQDHQYSKQEVGYDFDDYYADTPQVKISSRILVDGEENRRQLRELLQKQKIEEKYVESVDEDVDGHASIVIERMNMPNSKKEEAGMLDRNNHNVKSNKNYYEIQLSHSQSENVIPQFRQTEHEEDKENQSNHASKEEIPSSIQDIVVEQTQPQQQRPIQKEQQEEHIQQTEPIQQAPLAYSLIDQIDRQAYGELKKISEEYSQAKEEIEDEVQPINYHSQLNNNAQLTESVIVPTLFHSQTSPRRTLQEEKDLQSIVQQSLDYHPLQSPILEVKQESPHNSPEEPIKKEPTERKVSFKKLIASNKPNLVPRLAISTILNEQINEAFGEHRLNPHHFAHPTPISNDKLHESIVSETPSSKPSKLNFKKALMSKNSKSGSKDSKKESTQRDNRKQEKNKLLLKSFFDEN